MGGNAIKLPGVMNQVRMCARYLSNSMYKDAFSKFDYSACPLYWKLFFWSAKNEQVWLFYIMTKAMRKILERRKK